MNGIPLIRSCSRFKTSVLRTTLQRRGSPPAWYSRLRSRQQLVGSRLAAPKRLHIGRLVGQPSTPSDSDYQYHSYDSDDELPPPPTPFDPSLCDIVELKQKADRFIAELEAYDRAMDRRHARELAKARKASGASPGPSAPPPLTSLAAEWPPVSDSTLPEDSAARASVAEAAAAAAVAFAGAAVGHEAAAEAAYAAAATQPASSLSSAGEEWLRAGAAWRKAFESLAAARRAQPGSLVVEEAAGEVEAARRFKHQLRGLPGRVAEDLP
ncbi:hypothetical protein ABPG77_000817 [Micractinium sp. CCAP 211/92]